MTTKTAVAGDDDHRREPILRHVDFRMTPKDEDRDSNGMTLEGYAAVFNTPTRIDSWEGKFDEVISAGAFKKTLQERADRVVLQFDHGQHPLIGSIPIGRIVELREDAAGLYVKAELFDNDLVAPVRQAIEGGAIKGMSFRFSVVGERIDEDPDVPVRTITEVKLYEIGPVVFPAYEGTSVGVRAVEFVRSLINDNDFRDQVTSLLAAAPNLPADTDGVTGSEAATPHVEAAPEHFVDRSGEHKSVLDRIRTHIPKDEQ